VNESAPLFKPTASVAMPCHNVADTLRAQLDLIVPQVEAAGAELILLDNNSTDATSEIMAQASAESTHVVVAQAHDGTGVAYARNQCLAIARSDRFLFCDADDLVSEHWVAVMIDALDRNSVVTGSLEIASLNSELMAASRGGGECPSFYGIYNVAAGGNLGMHREVWEAVGPLDESLPSLEDQDWSLRAWLAGYRVAHVPDAVIHYRYRTGVRELWHQGWIYGRSRPPIGRRLRDATGERPSRLAGLKSWIWLVVHSAEIVRPAARDRLAWVAGNRLGQLRGCVDARFLLL